jgi:hypothetical protein
MKITISTPTFDTFGHITINAKATTDLGETRRRMNRVATLDGGAVVNDFGYSHADRTIKLTWAPDATLDAQVDYVAQNYPAVNLAMSSGFYSAAIEVFTRGDESSLTLLITGKQA